MRHGPRRCTQRSRRAYCRRICGPTSGAQAIPDWYSCEKVLAGTGSFENNICTKTGGTKESGLEDNQSRHEGAKSPNTVNVTDNGRTAHSARCSAAKCSVK